MHDLIANALEFFMRAPSARLAWVLLFSASAFEVGFAVMLKYSEGFTKIIPSLFVCVFAILSFAFLNLCIRTLPVGTAYAIWTGIGALGVATYGILIFNEPFQFARILCLALILIGVVGLPLLSNHS